MRLQEGIISGLEIFIEVGSENYYKLIKKYEYNVYSRKFTKRDDY